jgi:hypothetical protein
MTMSQQELATTFGSNGGRFKLLATSMRVIDWDELNLINLCYDGLEQGSQTQFHTRATFQQKRARGPH